jgi:hypothetical protein
MGFISLGFDTCDAWYTSRPPPDSSRSASRETPPYSSTDDSMPSEPPQPTSPSAQLSSPEHPSRQT